jgi:TPP-dependent 2-oxoacid decarboxylase
MKAIVLFSNNKGIIKERVIREEEMHAQFPFFTRWKYRNYLTRFGGAKKALFK